MHILNIKQLIRSYISGRPVKIAIFTIYLVFICPCSTTLGNTYLQVYAKSNNYPDTLGWVEHYLKFGERIAVFIPPYTAHFFVFPMEDSSYSAKVDFFGLGPGYSFHQENVISVYDRWHKVEDLPAKGDFFDYYFRLIKDTIDNVNFISKDSLTNFESVHYRSWIWGNSYADFKWKARSGYLEGIFDLYRKRLKVTRSGKIDFYIFPTINNAYDVDIYSGVGFDIPSGKLYAVFHRGFDSALPEITQLFVIYETWGYSARMLAVGFARYYLDDIYLAKKMMSGLSASEIKAVLTDEFPEDIHVADILCGAFARYLIDEYGLAPFKMLYEKSSPGNLMFADVYDKSFDELLRSFIDYEKKLELDEPTASYFSNMYASQHWFDKALPYEIWLASRSNRRGVHLKGLGACFFHLGRYAGSESCYTVLSELYPDVDEPVYLQGQAFLRTGKFKKAVESFQKIFNSYPNAAKMLTETYLDENLFEEAKAVQDNIKGIPDSWTAILKARLAIADGHKSKADTILKKGLAYSGRVISKVPGEGRGYIDAGYLLMFMSSYKNAETEFMTALFVDDRPYYQASAYLALGRLYDLKDDHQKAIEYYDKAVDLNSGEYINKLATDYIARPFKLR